MIRVIGDYLIDVDELNYTVKVDKHRTAIDKKTGAELPVYEVKGYYNSLDAAIKGVRDLAIANSLKGAEMSLNEAVKAVADITDWFVLILNGSLHKEGEQ